MLGRALSSDLNDITAEWEARQNLSRIFSGMPAAMVDYELVLVGANGIVVGSGNGGVTCPSSELLTLPALQTAIHTDRIAYEGRKEGFTFLTQHIPVIYGCRPLTGSDGSLYGALFILIPEQSLRQFYQSFSSQSTSILLLSSDGTILSSNLTDDIGEKTKAYYFLPGKIRSGAVSTLTFLVVGLFYPVIFHITMHTLSARLLPPSCSTSSGQGSSPFW